MATLVLVLVVVEIIKIFVSFRIEAENKYFKTKELKK